MNWYSSKTGFRLRTHAPVGSPHPSLSTLLLHRYVTQNTPAHIEMSQAPGLRVIFSHNNWQIAAEIVLKFGVIGVLRNTSAKICRSRVRESLDREFGAISIVTPTEEARGCWDQL